MVDYFRALPAYLGGKRRLAPLIFAALEEAIPRRQWHDLRFLDPFLGGGSVSLQAKALGFDVHCSDLAMRSALVGRALVENHTTKISPADLKQLLRPPTDAYPRLAEERFSPSVFPLAHARLIDRALHNARSFEAPRRQLLLLMLLKWMLRCQPMSMVRGTDARAAATGDLDRVSPQRLGHYLRARDLLSAAAFMRLAADVNAGVFPGRGQAYQMDAMEFLAEVSGDVVYLDPPYAGTTSYEREYAVIDQLFEGFDRPVSAFSGKQPPLQELLDLSRSAEVLVLSYYSTSSAGTEAIHDLVARTHEVRRLIEVPFRHLGSIAGDERNRTNRELMVIGTRRQP